MYLPALYVALTEVNPSILPTSLFIIMQGSSLGQPFPPPVQVILMVLVIETLREAALRLPKPLSATIGTMGAIVVGTAVVKAGLVDPQIIVVMTLTALSMFSTPIYELTSTWRIINFTILAAALVLGMLGIVLVTMLVLVVLMDMQSFGTPYLSPWAPFRWRQWSDGPIRLPWTRLHRRWFGARSIRTLWRRPVSVDLDPHLYKAQQAHTDRAGDGS
jgi:spore germination protein KA